MRRRSTEAERILRAHNVEGRQLADGRLRVLDVWAEPDPSDATARRACAAWRIIERRELLGWLGYDAAAGTGS